MKRILSVTCCVLFLFAALLCSAAFQSRAEEDSPDGGPEEGGQISWMLGRDSERKEPVTATGAGSQGSSMWKLRQEITRDTVCSP